MIKAEELRIGNYISYGKELRKERVYKIDFHRKLGHIVNNELWETDLEPIPLNSLLLTESGFKHDKITYGLGQIMLAEGNVGFDVWYNTLTYGLMNLKLEYLHQLQNFVFALTQKELEIKL